MWQKLFPLVYERYLAKQIYLSFAFILFALTSLFVFFDFIAEIRDTNNTYSVALAFLTVLMRPRRFGVAGSIDVMSVVAVSAAVSMVFSIEFLE